MLWDTAGQEEFDAITKAYYRGETTSSPDVGGALRFDSLSFRRSAVV